VAQLKEYSEDSKAEQHKKRTAQKEQEVLALNKRGGQKEASKTQGMVPGAAEVSLAEAEGLPPIPPRQQQGTRRVHNP
jgi:hypothetical protein